MYNPLTETKESWLALLKATESFYTQFKLLLDAGYGERIRYEFQKGMNENISPNSPLYYSNCYWAGAIWNIIFEWIRNDMDLPIAEIAEVGYNLMIDGIKTISKYGNSCK